MPAHRATKRRRKKLTERRDAERRALGLRLRSARIAAGLTAETIAKKMDVALSTYYSWEAGERSPRGLAELATVVRCSVGALYGERAA
jgi:transcriptional regulator with XRE-family HTH domain